MIPVRIAIGLIGLGVAGGIIPTGLAGIGHAGAVVGGTVAALALLVGICLAAPMLARGRSRTTAPGAKWRPSVSPIRSPARGI
ncbi:MAG TPA: hypothetical protein VL948_01590 [Verrucomicrobiae bacterium]|nr:hypothetical protein [Verrucomicrobiae bacterium]